MPVAIVTGAAGGIGTAICALLAERGWRVAGLDIAAGPCAAERLFACDIGDFHDAPERAPVAEMRAFCGGRLDLLVNNAAVQVKKPTAELSPADWDATMRANVSAPFALVRTFLTELAAAKGSVVNIASIHAHLTKPEFVAYATSKGALLTMTRALAVDLGAQGIRVNAIAPAATDTPMLRAGFEGNPAGYAALAAMHPLGRIATTREVAEAVHFLASPAAGFISGATLGIDGGIAGRLHDPA